MQKYRKLLDYARPHWRFFVLIFILTIAASALAVLQPVPLALLTDCVLGAKPLPSRLRPVFEAFSMEPASANLLFGIVAGGLVLFALNSVLETGLTWAWTLGGRRMVYALAEDLFARLQRRSLLFHRRNAVGDSMGRVAQDSWAAYHVVDALFFAPGHALLTMWMMMFLMAQLDLTLTMLALAVAPLVAGASLLVGKPLRAAAKMKREIESRIQSHIQQTLTGIPVVQAFVQEEREHRRFQHFADAAIAAQQRSTLIGGINSLSSGLVATLGTGAILWVGARHVFNGNLTIGGLLFFLVYLTSLQTQMKVFADIYTKLQGLSASVDRVVEILEADPEVKEKPDAILLAGARGQVHIDHVAFGYEPGRPVLRGVSMEARPGQTLAIVGSTGAGKTTLVNLIPRFFDPWEGRVLVDGHDVRDVRLKSLREQIAVVLQEPLLFPISIAENIAYGRPGASRSEIEASARVAHAHEFVLQLPQGYDTVIGERGATLSGGERQRISIARAFLKNAPILILDEPTSALDAGTEHLIRQALERLMKGRTTFLIAHRLSTVRHADCIAVLQDGQIAESGTHDELLARGALYARFHNTAFEPKRTAVQFP
ncbi:MAG: ABC transporter ATP-binding protein [Verrucomicrobia bacterium]|nr:MAG: ABC transporter ATP-binding protein [Verrucomicrobiota bacterium]